MAVYQIFNNTILLPLVENSRKAVFAFLQTSVHGSWRPDATRHDTQLTFHFIRGKWGTAFFKSGLVPLACDVDSAGVFIERTKPMRLEVTFRPSPRDIVISLSHIVFSKKAIPPHQSIDYIAFWRHRSRQEAESLRKYLEQCYDLDGNSRLESSSDKPQW